MASMNVRNRISLMNKHCGNFEFTQFLGVCAGVIVGARRGVKNHLELLFLLFLKKKLTVFSFPR